MACKKYMPITYWTSLVGTLALIGFPGFSGFYSKDSIIEAVHASTIPGSTFAYYAVLIGVFVTALYSLRMFFIVFHGKERMDHHTQEHLKESPWVVTVPLVLLAIPSVIIGGMTISSVLYGDYFNNVVFVQQAHDVLGHLKEEYHGPLSMILHGIMQAPFFLMVGGIATAWYLYMKNPELPGKIKNSFALIYDILDNKYGFDTFNEKVIAGGTRGIGHIFSKFGDIMIIDGIIVNGSAKSVAWFSSVIRHVQTGYLYHYAFVMILGLIGLLALVVY